MSNASSLELPERGQLVLGSIKCDQVTLLIGPYTSANDQNPNNSAQESRIKKSQCKAGLVYSTENEYFIQRNGSSRRIYYESSIEVRRTLGCNIVFDSGFNNGGEPSPSILLYPTIFLAGAVFSIILCDLMKTI
ncbi:hypothetical protein F4811DRAFT_572942 [Daldinia bambusicola]|nr:hypothetical protein F4811DRAFT_572942 [Daldinia bambusicola]